MNVVLQIDPGLIVWHGITDPDDEVWFEEEEEEVIPEWRHRGLVIKKHAFQGRRNSSGN